MNFVQILTTRFRGNVRSAFLAQRIADRGFERIWHRVADRVLDLAPAEARGYVRARGEDILRDLAVAECGSGPAATVFGPAMKLATDRVIDRAYALRTKAAIRRAA